MDMQYATDEQRKAAVAQAVAYQVTQGGRVEARTDFNAVLRFGKPFNHGLHALISLLTCGMWLFGWPIAYALNKYYARMIDVDEYGRILVTEL